MVLDFGFGSRGGDEKRQSNEHEESNERYGTGELYMEELRLIAHSMYVCMMDMNQRFGSVF